MALPSRFNPIASFLDPMIAALGDAFNLWFDLLANALPGWLEEALKSAGLAFPPGKEQLKSFDGAATSTAKTILTLSCDVGPVDPITVAADLTQVETEADLAGNLTQTHVALRNQNPPAVGSIPVGTYLGLAASQNALNYYLFAQWQTPTFVFDANHVTSVCSTLSSLPPPRLAASELSTFKIWLAAPPRVEVAIGDVINGTRPVVVYFDDVRVCMEFGPKGPFEAEFSCNWITTGTYQLAWPQMLDLFWDVGAWKPINEAAWEFALVGEPLVMEGIDNPPAFDLQPLVAQVGQFLAGELVGGSVAGQDASNIGAAVSPLMGPAVSPLLGGSFQPTMPAMEQQIAPAHSRCGRTESGNTRKKKESLSFANLAVDLFGAGKRQPGSNLFGRDPRSGCPVWAWRNQRFVTGIGGRDNAECH